MKCRKLSLCMLGFLAGTMLFYLVWSDRYGTMLGLLPIDLLNLMSDDRELDSSSDTNRSDDDVPVIPFQSRLSPYYPHIPVHIYTQNLTSEHNRTKLILLANPFFGDATWGFQFHNQSSVELMSQLSCPTTGYYCNVTKNKKLFSKADAVVYHMRDDIDMRLAKRKRRRRQRFIFALWESPMHTPDLKPYHHFFNWTLTYRLDSHIVASYYFGNGYIHKSSDYYHQLLNAKSTGRSRLNLRTIDHRPSDDFLSRKKLATVAALISNCAGPSRRFTFIKYLTHYIDVKLYGACGEPCPINMDCREFIAQNHHFFLSFENSLCTDYATEKLFSTLQYHIVPVVFGRTNYSRFIPSSGFIQTDDFPTISALARHLNRTRDDKEKYLSHFTWKKDYVWGGTHFLTPFCDLCLRLHLDAKPNVINDIDAWWNDGTCKKSRLKLS